MLKDMNDALARLDERSLEDRYRQKGHAYLSVIARRLRLLDSNELNALLDQAESAGALNPTEEGAPQALSTSRPGPPGHSGITSCRRPEPPRAWRGPQGDGRGASLFAPRPAVRQQPAW